MRKLVTKLNNIACPEFLARSDQVWEASEQDGLALYLPTGFIHIRNRKCKLKKLGKWTLEQLREAAEYVYQLEECLKTTKVTPKDLAEMVGPGLSKEAVSSVAKSILSKDKRDLLNSMLAGISLPKVETKPLFKPEPCSYQPRPEELSFNDMLNNILRPNK